MRRAFEYGGFIAAAVLIVFGIGAIFMGWNAQNTVHDSLAQEQIVGTPDMTPTAIQAEAQKADEVQAAGTAKAGGQHGDTVAEGGPPPETTFTKGAPKPAASKADEDGTPVEGTSSATVGRAEMNQAAGIGATKTASGRGRRKAEAKADTSE